MRKHRGKIYRMRGKRTHGAGASKNRRGKGSRKTNKRTFGTNIAHVRKYEPWRINKRGFVSLYKKDKGINLDEIDKLADKEIDITTLGYGKVLGGGALSRPLKIKAHSFSKKAKERIQKAGGEAIEV
jgi:large subunit ribosomal protein L15